MEENINKRKDKQLAGKSSSTQFMSMKDSYTNNKKVTFDMQNGIEEKINRLTMMISKLTTKEEGLNNQFKPKYIKEKEEEKIEIFMIGVIIRIDIGQKVEIGEFYLVVRFNVDRIG